VAGTGPELGPAAELAYVLISEQTPDELLQLVVTAAGRTVAGADGVSVSLARGGVMLTASATDAVARELAEFQHQREQGPCLEAMRLGHPVGLSVPNDDGRFDDLADMAGAFSVTALLSVPLLTPKQPVGTINFYSKTVAAFGEEPVATAGVFARHAAVLLANVVAYASSVALNASLRDALDVRQVVGEAKGILMVRENCTSEEAFDRLRMMSQATQRKIRDLAEEVVQSVQRH
jgi:GAF domain-containing protein